jgi:hypothetical protein
MLCVYGLGSHDMLFFPELGNLTANCTSPAGQAHPFCIPHIFEVCTHAIVVIHSQVASQEAGVVTVHKSGMAMYLCSCYNTIGASQRGHQLRTNTQQTRAELDVLIIYIYIYTYDTGCGFCLL